MFRFITHKPFWVNLLAALLLFIAAIAIFLQLLGWLTRHGQYLTVPSVIGEPTEKAVKYLESKGFEVIIQDSIFIDTASRGIVLKQLPDPNSTVKINRTVLLTVNRVTLPMIDMPALVGKTLSYALNLLKRSHLELGDTTFRTDFMKGSVLDQQFNGNSITPGSKVQWGSHIDLVVGNGLTEERILVPSVTGLTLAEARIVLEESGISIGAVIPEQGVKDTSAGFVYKQSPPRLTEDNQPSYIRSGQFMDLWISSEKKVIDSTQTP